jgi:four helix bundle protein
VAPWNTTKSRINLSSLIYKFQFLIYNQFAMSQVANEYNLEDRTAKFGESVIRLCKTLPDTTISRPIISQIIRSATSIGANYCEANGASSKKDFQNKIFICKKEAQETKHWLRMLATCFEDRKEELQVLWREGQELTLIFQKITTTLRNK